MGACKVGGIAVLGFVVGAALAAQGEVVRAATKISRATGGFTLPLRTNDQLGRALARIGDLDLDGVPDVAAAGHSDDDGGTDRGAAYVLFLRSDGSVKALQKISSRFGGFRGPLRNGDQMGRALTGLGDLDGDGIPDLAAGANFDDDGGANRGAVWIFFLNRDGTVKGEAKLSSLRGVTGLDDRDEFGRSLAALGDADGDGVPDLAVGAPYDDDGGGNKGAVHVLYLRPDGTVKAQKKISQRAGAFAGPLRANDLFGFSLGNLGDFDGDGVVDLAVGAALDDDGSVNAGALWVLLLNADGSVKAQQKISRLAGGFTGLLESPDQFGTGVAAVGDLDGDGRPELAVGAVKDNDGGAERGSVWLLFLGSDLRVRSHAKISATAGGFPFRLRDIDWLGSSVCALGDLDGDGTPDLGIGARNDDDGGSNLGALYMTFLRPVVPALMVDAGGAPRAARSGPGAGFRPIGFEPAGTLRLAQGEVRPGQRLVFALDALGAPAGSLPWLALAAARGPGRLIAGAPLALAQADGGPEEAELVLRLPADAALCGRRFLVQGGWTRPGGGVLALSDVGELVVGE